MNKAESPQVMGKAGIATTKAKDKTTTTTIDKETTADGSATTTTKVKTKESPQQKLLIY